MPGVNHLFHCDKNFQRTVIAFTEVCVCSWTDCVPHNARGYDIVLTLFFRMHSDCLHFSSSSTIHQHHLFIGSLIHLLFIYFMCSLVSLMVHSFGAVFLTGCCVHAALSAEHMLFIVPAFSLSLLHSPKALLSSYLFCATSLHHDTACRCPLHNKARFFLRAGVGERAGRFIIPISLWALP